MTERCAPDHWIRLLDQQPEIIDELLERSMRMKRDGGRVDELVGKTIGLLFFRGSLRTRASLSTAVYQLGGQILNLTAASDFWELEENEGSVMDGRAPEHIKDAAAVLSSYVDLLAIRPAPAGQSWTVDRKDAQIRSWAKYARVPVVNTESALWHPLQALADLLTLRETLGDLSKKELAITWTHSPSPVSHSVTNSLLCTALRAGMNVRVAHPPGFELDDGVLREARKLAAAAGTELETQKPLREAVEGAHVVYARSWNSLASYGNPTLAASQRARHSAWTIDEKLMAFGNEAKLMHAMPVRRNVEVSDALLDGPRSLVYEQAANRLHAQKALLSKLLSR